MVNQRIIRQKICSLTGMSEEQFANHLLDSMEGYTDHWCDGDRELSSELLGSGQYVRWFVHNYYKRCKVLLNCHPISKGGVQFLKRFERIHNPESIRNYPNRVILEQLEANLQKQVA